jgi:probable HAF family extracellular repeat protein
VLVGRRSLLLIACATVAGLAVSGTAAAAPLTVQPIELEAPGYPTYATDVNAAGIVVGGVPATVDGVYGGFGARWQNGALSLVYPPGATQSWANSVNLLGDIGGNAVVNDVSQAFIRRGTTFVMVHPPGAVSSMVVDLNERRDALVSWQDSTQYGNLQAGSHLSLWRNGMLTEITPPDEELVPFDTGASRSAYINTRGQVAGVFRPRSADGSGIGTARLWQAGRFTTITTSQARLQDLSERGQVVGVLTDATGTGPAFSWYSGRLTKLPGGTRSVAYAVNERGQVAGEITLSDDVAHAAVWTDGRLTDLGTLGGTRSTARDINNLGQVAGSSRMATQTQYGYPDHPFVWRQGVFTDLTPGAEGSSSAQLITDTGYVVGTRSLYALPRVYFVATAWRVSSP